MILDSISRALPSDYQSAIEEPCDDMTIMRIDENILD